MAATSSLEFLERDAVFSGSRRVKYHRHRGGLTNADGQPVEDSDFTGWAIERVEFAPREILLDRWNGATNPGGNGSKLETKLWRILDRLTEAVTRLEPRGDYEHEFLIDGDVKPLSEIMEQGELVDVIRDFILERAAKVAELR